MIRQENKFVFFIGNTVCLQQEQVPKQFIITQRARKLTFFIPRRINQLIQVRYCHVARSLNNKRANLKYTYRPSSLQCKNTIVRTILSGQTFCTQSYLL